MSAPRSTAAPAPPSPPASPSAPTAASSIANKAILCAIFLVGANVLFHFLSKGYFATHREIINGAAVLSYDAAEQAHVRMTFILLTCVLAAAAFLASMWPRAVGHAIPAVLGALQLIGGLVTFRHDTPMALGATLVISGVMMPLLVWLSYRRVGAAARPAWAFLVAICGTFAVIGLFGAPKLRGALDIGLWTAMLWPGLNLVAVFALLALRADYVERETVAT